MFYDIRQSLADLLCHAAWAVAPRPGASSRHQLPSFNLHRRSNAPWTLSLPEIHLSHFWPRLAKTLSKLAEFAATACVKLRAKCRVALAKPTTLTSSELARVMGFKRAHSFPYNP